MLGIYFSVLEARNCSIFLNQLHSCSSFWVQYIGRAAAMIRYEHGNPEADLQARILLIPDMEIFLIDRLEGGIYAESIN